LAFDEPVSQGLFGDDRSQLWEVTLQSAGDFRVELTNLSADFDLFVTGPEGRKESSRASGQNDDVVVVSNASPGTYYIEVRRYAAGGLFRLAARRGAGALPTATPSLFDIAMSMRALRFDEPVAQVMAPSDRSHRYQLALPNPGDFRIELTDLEVDFDLYVTGPGEPKESRNSGSTSDVVLMPGAAAGTYTIEVRPWLDNVGGRYRLAALHGATSFLPSTSPSPGTFDFRGLWDDFFFDPAVPAP
jgi:hypothetical protein